MNKTYSTAEIAKIVGVHPNTVRFYEKVGLLPVIPRKSNGYRAYNLRHLSQLRLIRVALRGEILSDNLRKEVLSILKTSATENIDKALDETIKYQQHLEEEKAKAEEAISIVEEILDQTTRDEGQASVNRRETADILGVTIDILRNWERNGLVVISKDKNGRCRYDEATLKKLKVISILRNANYSYMSILRMFDKIKQGEKDLQNAIDTPDLNEDIIYVTDRYISSLSLALNDVKSMFKMLQEMKNLG